MVRDILLGEICADFVNCFHGFITYWICKAAAVVHKMASQCEVCPLDKRESPKMARTPDGDYVLAQESRENRL